MRRGRGGLFQNRSLVLQPSASTPFLPPTHPPSTSRPPVAAPAPSTPVGFVRRGNSLINISALAASVSISRHPPLPHVPKPPPAVPPPPANPPAVKLKYSFHRHPPPPQALPPHRSYAPMGRGRGRGRPATLSWRRLSSSGFPSSSFLHRVLNRKARNLTLKTAIKSGPTSKISKHSGLNVAGVQYRKSMGGNRLVRVFDNDTPRKGNQALIKRRGDVLRPSAPRQLIPGQRKVKDCYLWIKTGIGTTLIASVCAEGFCKMMPVCSFFLKGMCTNERCIYSHVKVNHDAEICKAFQEGFCEDGASCTKLHTNVCQEFKHSGKCPRGAKCKLRHPVSKKRRLDESAKKLKKSRSVIDEEDREITATEGALAVGAQDGGDADRRSIMPGSR